MSGEMFGKSIKWEYCFLLKGTVKRLGIREPSFLVEREYLSFLLSGSNGTPTHNHLVCKRTPNHLAKLAQTDLFG